MRRFDDELDGADFVERGDGAAGDDGEIGCERGDGDEAEVGAGGEEFVGAERGLGVVEGVALASVAARGGCSKSHMRGAGLRKLMAATRSLFSGDEVIKGNEESEMKESRTSLLDVGGG